MADAVQQRVEAGLEELHALAQRQVLSEEETRQIVKRRRELEYECSSPHGDTVRAFLVYIHYEVNLLALLRLRCRAAVDANRSRLQQLRQQQRLLRVQEQQQQKTKKQEKATHKQRSKVQKNLQQQQQRQQQRQQRRITKAKDLLHAVVRTGSRRVYRLCRRLLQRHSTSLALWYSCVDLLLQLGSTRQLQQLLLHALRQFPCCSGLWILAADRLLQQGQLLAARRLLLTALRFNSSSVALWTELLRLEAAVVLRKARAIHSRHSGKHRQQRMGLPNTSFVSGAAVAAAASFGGGVGECKPQQTQEQEGSIKEILWSRVGEEEDTATAGVGARRTAEAAFTAEAECSAGGGSTVAREQDAEEAEEGRAAAAADLPRMRGDTMMVVLKAAVEKLRHRPRKRGGAVAAAGATAAGAGVAAEEGTCRSSGNSGCSGGSLPVAAVNSRLQDFLLRALELCLSLQASEAAPVMQQELLPPLQQQISFLLHEQAQQQPLLRVYEWKVLLLQAVSAASAAAAANAAEAGSSASFESMPGSRGTCEKECCSVAGRSSSTTRGAVVQAFEGILKECERHPHLLLLLALLLHALHYSSTNKPPLPSAEKEAAAAAAGAAGPGEDTGIAVDSGEGGQDIFCVLDVEGDAEGHPEAPRYGGEERGSSARDTEAGEGRGRGEGGGGGEGGREKAADAGAASLVRSPEAQLDAGSYLIQLYGGAHADADLFARYMTAAEDDAATSFDTTTAMQAGSAGGGHGYGQPIPDTVTLRQLEMLSEIGWPQVLLLLQRQPRFGKACLLLLHEDADTDSAGKFAAAAAGNILAEPQLLQLQRETLWNALWDSAGPASGEQKKMQVQEQRLWLIRSLLKALQHLYEQQALQQPLQKRREMKRPTDGKCSGFTEQATPAVVGAFVALGRLLLELVRSAAAQVRASYANEVYVHLNSLQHVHYKLQQLTEGFLQQQQQQGTIPSFSETRQQQQLAQLVLLLLDIRRSRLPLLPEQQHQQLPDQHHSPPLKKTKTLRHEGGVAGTGMTEQPPLKVEADVRTGAATHLDFIRRFKGSLGWSEASGLLQHYLLLAEGEARPRTSGGKRTGGEADAGGASVLGLLPTWFQELLAAAAPSAIPPLVQHFCQHRLTQRVMRAAQQKNEGETDRFEESELQQPHKRRKLLVLHRGKVLDKAASSGIRAVVAPDGWECGKRGFRAELVAVLQWSRACVLSLNDSAFCVRLCNAARLNVCVEMCEFIIRTLWGCVARCRVYAAAVWGGAAACWPAYVLRALLQQSRDVYICVLAAFEKCGLRQHLVLQEQKAGRGGRLQQQEQVLRRHVLQHLANACHQQVRWWVEYWRFSRFCEEAAGMLRMQLGNCSFFLHSRPGSLVKAEVKKYSFTSDSAGATPSVETREEIERQAEQALGEGSAALAAFREALAAEVAAPCALQQRSSDGCTSCGPYRLWCSYATAAHATGNSVAAVGSRVDCSARTTCV